MAYGSASKCSAYDSRVINQDYADWDRVIRINLTGTMYSMKEELKYLMKGGSIVNVSSYTGLQGMPKFSAYCAAKHGVIGLTKSAAKEMGPVGIRVNVVIPGNIDTPMLHDIVELGNEGVTQAVAATPIPRLADPKEVSNVIVFLLSQDASFVTGSAYVVDGGLIA